MMKKRLTTLLTGIALAATGYAALSSENQTSMDEINRRVIIPISNNRGWHDGYSVQWHSVCVGMSGNDTIDYSFVYAGDGRFYELTIEDDRGMIVILDKSCDEHVDRLVMGNQIYSRDDVDKIPELSKLFRVSDGIMSETCGFVESYFERKAGIKIYLRRGSKK